MATTPPMAPMPPMPPTMPMPPPSGNTPPMPPMPMPTMHAAFFWGHRVQVIFPNWPGEDRESHRMYVLSLVVVAALAALAEVLGAWSRALAGHSPTSTNAVVWTLQLTWIHVLKTGLLYLVMLAAMSFNGGVFLAVVVGHAAGFLIVRRWMAPPPRHVDGGVRTNGAAAVPPSSSEEPKP